ncbi:transcription factor bHLH113-like [Canna indica]|uniref:Transcription factor bHLH113-like n=1 Tax=Canna indica TaxID=4628 RepID=A0AAQ3JM78_9LILI|nr:transcription factor bHLH113-like [Canna indica]
MEEEGFGQMDDESFMDMLRSGEDEGYVFSPKSCLSSPTSSCYSSSAVAAQMLWFGGKEEEGVAVIHGVPQKSNDSSLSSLSSSPPSTTLSSPKSPSKKAASTHSGRGRRTSTSATATRLTSTKKPKTESSAGTGTIMVRREKLGERIMALQQLVSPFGKSDTASVLHEALGYIRFLHDQVQVLSSPYLQGLPSSTHQHQHDGGGNDLRSRGLCLVPIACTEHVTRSNGADLWSPAVRNSRCSSSSSKH